MAETAAVTEDTLVGFLTIKEAIALWADAPGEEEDEFLDLVLLLQAAHEDLMLYAPRAVFAPEKIPAGVKVAQVLMAQHTFARARTGNQETHGAEGFQMSTYPLVLEAKSKMRRYRGQFRGLR